MAIDFPYSPTIDQTFSAVGKSWLWDGEKWIVGHYGAAGASDEILQISSSTVLPQGFDGVVLANSTTTTITITLPSSPNLSQSVLIKDSVGSATAHPITVLGGGVTIEGQTSLMIMYNYGWLDLLFTGTQWVQT